MEHPMPDILKMTREEVMERVENTKLSLKVVNDDPKPLAGTDITGRGKHQYTRIAIVATKKGPLRHFMLFVESRWLQNKCHDLLKSPDWMRDEHWDNRWNYIEEILHKPTPGETLDQYTKKIDDSILWLAVYHLLKDEGVLDRAVKKYTGKAYGVPRE